MKKTLVIALVLLAATGTALAFADPGRMRGAQTGEKITVTGRISFDDEDRAVLAADGNEYVLAAHRALVRWFDLTADATVTVTGYLISEDCDCGEDHGPVLAPAQITIDGKTHDLESMAGAGRRENVPGGMGRMRGSRPGGRGFPGRS